MVDIDEIRAKAIASMSSYANPRSSINAKSPELREEGELSSGEDAVRGLPTCSSTPSDDAPLNKLIPATVSREGPSSKAVNITPSSSNMTNMELSSSVPSKYIKHFMMNQVSLKSRNNQTLGWHGKDLDDNLVIRFSDDDSGSDSEESKLEKNVTRKVNTVRFDNSKMPTVSTPTQPGGLSGYPTNRTEHMLMKRFVTSERNSSNYKVHGERSVAFSVENDPQPQRYNPHVKSSTSQGRGLVQSANVADHKLNSLRYQIAVRENELKVHSKSMLQNKEGTTWSYNDQQEHQVAKPKILAGINTHGPIPTMELAADEHTMKRLKLDEKSKINIYSEPSKDMHATSGYKVEEGNLTCREDPQPDRKRKEAARNEPQPFQPMPSEDRYNEALPLTTSFTVHDHVVTQKHDNRFAADIFFSNNQSFSGAVPVSSSTNLNQHLEKMKPNVVDGVPRQNILPIDRNPGSEIRRHSNISTGADVPILLQSNAARKCNLVGSQEILVNSDAKVSLDSNLILDTYSAHAHNSKSGKDELINIPGRENLQLESLMKLEELKDKELEEAQEHRHRCELEERRALKAYRKAQRDLVEANERCTLLYRDRELSSAKLQALVMDASSSMCLSSWRNRCEPALGSDKIVPNNLPSNLGSQIPSEGQVVDRLGYNCNNQYSGGASIYTSEPSDISGLNGTCVLAKRPNISSDDEDVNFPLDRRSVESRLSGDVIGGNYGGKITHMNLETERVPSNKTSQDYELLEATLRSKLVARLGARSSNINGACNGKGSETIGEDKRTSAPPREQWLKEGGKQLMSDLEVLRIVSRNAKVLILPGCCNDLPKTQESGGSLNSADKVVEHAPDRLGDSIWCRLKPARSTAIDSHIFDFAIDPFRPFCMFELRGRCNDGECPWQHVKNLKKGNLKHSNHPVRSNSVPAYQIGSDLIKVDSHLSPPVLARSTWQRGFSASFSFPFSVQRLLTQEAPFLQSGGDSVANDNRTKLSLYLKSQDGEVKQLLHRLPDSEQSLEMALDLFNREVDNQDLKKVLSLLSRATEADQNSIVLWILYLHIFYINGDIKKDDMFFHAVQNNQDSYELWLMYINSRLQLRDRLKIYDDALAVFCRKKDSCDEEKRYSSAYILDIFLQMIDFLCMSGNAEKATGKINGLLRTTEPESGDTVLTDIPSCLTVPDRCIFWFCCTYLLIYRKLPEPVVQQFELEKDLPFGIEWLPAELSTDRKDKALELMDLAFDIRSHGQNLISDRMLHSLAVNHIRCVAAVEGLQHSTDILVKYMNLYPTCSELILMSARLQHECTSHNLRGFEEALCDWPKEIPGVQCLWNQYAEHALRNRGLDFTEKLMSRWLQGSQRVTDTRENDAFGYLNLFLYHLLQKTLGDARVAINKALELATTENYKHSVREHAAFIMSNEPASQSKCGMLICRLLHGYLGDPRAPRISEPLSRRYLQNIKKPRIRRLIDNMLGPISGDSSLTNSVLEACFGPSLLPEKFDEPKDLVDFAESLMEITPANYQLTLLVYRSACRNFDREGVAGDGIRFWASSLLVNSIFQAIPVAPEHVWLEAAATLRNSRNMDISVSFHQQAVLVYPFSIKLWKSYLNLSRINGNTEAVIEAARKRGFELGEISD